MVHCLWMWAGEQWADLCWAGWVQQGRSQLTCWNSCPWLLVLGWLLKAWAGLAGSLFLCSRPCGPACSNEWPMGDTELLRRSGGRSEFDNQSSESPGHPSASCLFLHLEKPSSPAAGVEEIRALLADSCTEAVADKCPGINGHCHHHIIAAWVLEELTHFCGSPTLVFILAPASCPVLPGV